LTTGRTHGKRRTRQCDQFANHFQERLDFVFS
jgi:hypothetical protein